MEDSEPDLIEWKEDYYTGFDRFDREHVELADLANRVIEAIHAHRPQEEGNAAFNALLDRAAKHFDDEEALMSQTYYSHLAQHRANHNDLMRNLVGYAAKYRNGPFDACHVGQFLQDWLLEHVLQADVAYAPYFKERGLS